MSDARHLGTFNLFREPDGSLWITIAEAKGVQQELGMASGAVPLHIMAMRALEEAVSQAQIRRFNEIPAERLSELLGYSPSPPKPINSNI